jgi:hypothetical protein
MRKYLKVGLLLIILFLFRFIPFGSVVYPEDLVHFVLFQVFVFMSCLLYFLFLLFKYYRSRNRNLLLMCTSFNTIILLIYYLRLDDRIDFITKKDTLIKEYLVCMERTKTKEFSDPANVDHQIAQYCNSAIWISNNYFLYSFDCVSAGRPITDLPYSNRSYFYGRRDLIQKFANNPNRNNVNILDLGGNWFLLTYNDVPFY